MKRMGVASIVLGLSLALSACSGDEETPTPVDGLLPGQEQTETPPVELPEPPLDTFKGDTTTPEGTIGTYMNYMQLGDGNKVCELFTPSLLARYGKNMAACVLEVEEYAEAVLPSFDDSLPVADRLTIRMESNDGTVAKGGASVVVNEADDTKYFEGFDLVKNADNTWSIENLASAKATENPGG